MKIKSFLFETLVVLGFILLLFLFLPDFKLHSYYFWCVVVLMSVRYGVVAGVLSGAMSACLFSVLLYVSLDKKALETFFDLHYLLEPVLFILVGGIVGQVSQDKINKISELKEKNGQFQKTLFQSEKELALTQKAKNELEKRIVGELSTITTLYESAKRLESFKLEDIYTGVLQILREHLGVLQCSLYVLENNFLTLKASSMNDTVSPKTVSKTEGLIGIAFESKKVISIREALASYEFSKLKGSPMIAGPLVRRDGSVMGILAIEKLPFLRFTPSTIKMFSIILDWLSASIENALYVQMVKARNIQDEVIGLYTYDYFKKRLREEFLRTKKYSLPLSVLVLKIQDMKEVEPIRVVALLKSVYLILKNNLQDMDLIAEHESSGEIGIILPTLQGEELQKVKAKISEEINSYGFKPFKDPSKVLEFLILESSFSPKMQSEAELLNKLV